MSLDSTGFYERVCEALGVKPGRGSKAQIARKLGFTKTTAGSWEKGEMPGMNSLQHVAKVSELTNASLHWLLTGQGPKKVNERPYEPPRFKLTKEEFEEFDPDVRGEIRRQIFEVLGSLLVSNREKEFVEGLLTSLQLHELTPSINSGKKK